MLVGAKVCDLTADLLWFVCGLYVGIWTSSLMKPHFVPIVSYTTNTKNLKLTDVTTFCAHFPCTTYTRKHVVPY